MLHALSRPTQNELASLENWAIRQFLEEAEQGMDAPLIVYVVGAGASRGLSEAYPLGRDLAVDVASSAGRLLAELTFRRIRGLGGSLDSLRVEYWDEVGVINWLNYLNYPAQVTPEEDIIQFAIDVVRAGMLEDLLGAGTTVDRFLESATGATQELGRLLIAALITVAENNHIRQVGRFRRADAGSPLHPASHEEVWSWAPGTWGWLEVLGDRVYADYSGEQHWRHAIVTFNYDRSVEFYLANLFAAREGSAPPYEYELLRRVLAFCPVVHAHGLITHGFSAGGSLGFGNSIIYEEGVKGEIGIVGEGVEEFRSESGVPELMALADRVVFLGFGYDPRNLARIQPAEPAPNLWLEGTAYGEVGAERRIVRAVADTFDRPIHLALPTSTCLDLLREGSVWE